MKTKMMILLVGLASVLLAGCAKNCIQMNYGGGDINKKVKTSNGTLRVMNPGSALVGGNVLRGKVELLNSSEKSQDAKYRFQWYDQAGFKDGESKPWQPVVVSPNSSSVISDTAPSAQATRYTISICQ